MFDSHALVWDLKTGKLLWQHNFNNRKPGNIIFTQNNPQVVIDNGSMIETWDWRTDQINGLTLNTNSRRVHSPVFTPNGENLIVGTDDGAIQIWNWEKGKIQKTLGGHKYPIECLSVSTDGEFLASTSDDTTLRKWNIHTGRQVFSTLRGAGDIKPISIDPTGRYAIAPYGHDSASLAIYKIENGKLQQKLQGHHGNINAIDYLSHEKIITASDDHTLRVWDVKNGECLKILSGEHHDKVQTAVVTEHKGKVISASSEGKIVLWDLQKNNPEKILFEYTPPTRWEQYIFITQNGKMAITNKASESPNRGLPILLDLENQNKLAEWHSFIPGGGSIGGMLSPQGYWLVQVQGAEWNLLKIINLETQQSNIYEIANRLGDFWCFTSDEEKLICSSKLNKIVIIDLKSGNFDFVSIQNDARITTLAVSPNNKLGAIAADKQIRIWNMANGEELVSLNTDKTFVNLVFDPKNRYLVAGSNDMILHCFELQELIN